MTKAKKHSTYDQPLIDKLNGTDLEDPIFGIGSDGKPAFKKAVPFTLRRACIASLDHKPQGADGRPVVVTDAESRERYKLIKKIEADESLTVSEKAIIITLSKSAFSPSIAGQVEELLEK